MDHSHMSMSMTITSAMDMATAASATIIPSMAPAPEGGMDHDMGGMGMGGPGSCKISMLWNWYTIDSCFIAGSWHNTSRGMFAGSCIGVILLVVALEFLRRAGKEYDRFLVSQHIHALAQQAQPAPVSASSSDAGKSPAQTTAASVPPSPFRPNVLQQAIRALLHMVQFAVAYFIMLLAMYFNGYIIICIFIGAYIGYFIFGWETFNVKQGGNDRMSEEITVCCG